MKKAFEAVVIVSVIFGVYAFYGKASQEKAELKQEQDCLVSARGWAETQKCFDLMDSHKKP